MHNPQLPNREAAIEALEMAHALIQEAKGFGDGSVTDHLDAAENWLDKIGGFIALIPSPDQGEVIKHAWNNGYSTGQEYAADPPLAGLGKHNRQHGWELYASSLTDRNLVATPPVDSAKPGEAGKVARATAIFREWVCNDKYPLDADMQIILSAMLAFADGEAALSASLPEPQLGVERADVLATVLRCSVLSPTRAGLLTDALMPMLSALTVTSKEGV